MRHPLFAALHLALHDQQRRADDVAPKSLHQRRPDDDVGDAGLILDGDEHRTLRGTRPLPHRHDARQPHDAPVFLPHRLGAWAYFPGGQFVPQQRARMRLQRQPGGAIVRYHVLAGTHLRQVRRGVRLHLAREQRQRRRRLQSRNPPQRRPPVQPKTFQRIRLGQMLQHRPRQSGGRQLMKISKPPSLHPFRPSLMKPVDQPESQPHRAVFQRAVPSTRVDVGLPHFHSMLARVPHNLRWRVKPHRLGIQQRHAKRRRIMAF